MTHFEREIREQPEVLRGILASAEVGAAAERLRNLEPSLVLTLARGSSDNAVAFSAIWRGAISACRSPPCRPAW